MDASERDGAEENPARKEVGLRPLTIPNLVTLLRFVLIPFFVIAVLDSAHALALILFLIAGLSDSFDGYLARRFDMESVIGAYLDPAADKLLMTTAYIVLTVPREEAIAIPLVLTILALFRDLIIVIVALILYLSAGVRRFPPTIWGKLTTLFNVVTICVVLLSNALPVPPAVADICFAISLALIVFSGLHYLAQTGGLIEAAAQGRSSHDSSAD